ncbi:MAG: hypothetical protein F4062_07415 [Acidimicrobiia bacterium]|nr:hypothetical protein [Acidimicrobiia bacterium]
MRRRGGGTGTRWTVLALAGAGGAMAVDASGRIATGRRGWSLDWGILAGENLCVPAAAPSLRQRAAGAEDAAPVALETLVRASGGDVSQLAYAARAAGAGPGALGVLEVRNRTSAPVAVTLTLRPGDFWRPDGLWSVEIDDAGALANGARALWWQRPPAGGRLLADAAAATDGPHEPPPAGADWAGGPQRVRSRAGRSGAEFTWPVTHGTTLRVLLPLEPDDAAPPEPAVVPTLDQVGRGWDLHTAGGLRVAGLPDGRIEPLVAAAIRRLLALDVSPDAGDGPDGRLSPAERALVAAALAVAGYAQRAAEVVSLRAARNPASAARLARREAARVTARFGEAPAAVGAMVADAGAGGGWAGDRGGDDPALRAAFLLAVRDSLVAEEDGCLDLLPGAGADLAGSRPPIEVHRLVTGCGVLSFAVRWHDRRPALLWELAPPSTRLESWASVLAGSGAGEGTAGPTAAAPRLRATALAEPWSTRRPTGEELLGA